jgi:predicted transcriptional regulator of viral defense system
MKTVQDQVLTRICAKASGVVHLPADLLDLGSRAAVDQALSRLARAGTIRRLARGVYDFPQQDPRLDALSPSLARVAAAIGAR